MTTILDDELLTKLAVYWPPGALDDDTGEPAVGTAVERQCHWEDKRTLQIDNAGKQFMTTGRVFLKEAVVVDGWLWLSSKTVADAAGSALSEAPATPKKKQQIRAVDMINDIDNNETLYVAMI